MLGVDEDLIQNITARVKLTGGIRIDFWSVNCTMYQLILLKCSLSIINFAFKKLIFYKCILLWYHKQQTYGLQEFSWSLIA